MVRRNALNCFWDRFLECKHGILHDQDTISRLPESVLHHMIYFLPTLDKDQLRYLSRTWRRLDAQNRKMLCLRERRLNEQELTSILQDNFRSVEFLSLRNCARMKDLKLINFKLKTLELYYCGNLKNIHLKTPDLVSWTSCQAMHNRACCMQPTKFLAFSWGCYEHHDAHGLQQSFPVSRTLILSGCDLSGCINISSERILCEIAAHGCERSMAF